MFNKSKIFNKIILILLCAGIWILVLQNFGIIHKKEVSLVEIKNQNFGAVRRLERGIQPIYVKIVD